ncbi:MAG: undecaprenyldiphospho-muramoylpentapeptide beta-N-acetylglucosaminyltransferase [Armatimonadota bacterium]|nr:undecaprenyldiphospho-muramoylpentapeptide beta-N-acetylglucosaminyltransferase [Armatimonadota bacterium]MDW8025584.1 undecaprenyldiphospho-muramoylpentapeptide beta-N-acetylglucosaminyltransferase [Armatimonadota bacterium]
MAAGGTGGHIYPAIAVAEEVGQRLAGAKVVFVGTSLGLEKELIPKLGYDLHLLSARPFPKAIFNPASALAAVAALVSSLRALMLLKKLKPVLVLSIGGYASVPVVWASHTLNIPVVILEPNSIPGRANRKLAKWADAICVAFKSAMRFFKDNVNYTGMPVRRQFKTLTRERARDLLVVGDEILMLLVFGGSKGARRLNMALWETLEKLLLGEPRLIIHHICGIHGWNEAQAILRNLPSALRQRYFVRPYRDDMPVLIHASDIAVSRAGASSIAELLVAGVPSILVPYPYAMDDHQRYNALEVERAGAAVVVPDGEFDGELLYQLLSQLIACKHLLNKMREAALSIAMPDAAERVTNIALGIARL